MTVRKGSAYGRPAALPADGVVVRSDAEARAVLEEARRKGRPFPVLGLLGGDLWRTLGGRGDEARLRSPHGGVAFPVDVGFALVDGSLHLFVAHLVAHSRLWGRAVVAMNAQWWGRYNLGPRAHPGDGLLDVYEARLSPPERLKVRARLHHGAHLPHPGIAERRAPAVQVDLARPLPVVLDGATVGEGRHLSLRVAPDAVTVVV